MWYRLPNIVVVFALMLVSFVAIAEQNNTASNYRLDSGDVVNIQVYDEKDLSMEVRLSDAGTVNYPFLGQLRLSGKSISEVESIITSGLKGSYLINPKVSVSVKEYRQFYVNGQVASPGGYPYQPGLTVQRAVTLAGGFTERASRSKIFVVREGDTKKRGDKATLNSPVKPGDIVVVEESFF